MASDEDIIKVIKSVLRSRFRDIEISSIEVAPDVDEDGDKILAIKVIFSATQKILDSGETSGLVRRILPKMEKIGETRFPIFSFIAKSEMGKANPDSA